MGIRYNYEIVKTLFEVRGYELISTEYKGCKVKLEFICKKHIEDDIQLVNLDKFINRNQGCNKCGYERVAEFQTKHTIKEAKEKFNKRGYDLLSTTYKTNKEYLFYNCRKHPSDKPKKITMDNFLKGKGCASCGGERIDYSKRNYSKGSENAMWKGGITPLHNYLRDKISQWKIDSFKKYNYKCDITSKTKNKIVHHHYNFSGILKETMDTLNLPIYDVINLYTNKELENITQKCIELHYKYGLGVCLCESEHILFHSMYGSHDNTEQQYNEFKIIRLKIAQT